MYIQEHYLMQKIHKAERKIQREKKRKEKKRKDTNDTGES